MSTYDPAHLKLSIKLNYDTNWQKSEKLYRRFKMEGKDPFSLARLPRKDIANGISVNRSNYSFPHDVLYYPEENGNECNYIKKPPEFNYCTFEISDIINENEIIDPKTGNVVCKIFVKQSPNLFNVSHCDIIVLTIDSEKSMNPTLHLLL